MVQDCYKKDVKAVHIDTTAVEQAKATKNTISNTSNNRKRKWRDGEINESKMCIMQKGAWQIQQIKIHTNAIPT